MGGCLVNRCPNILIAQSYIPCRDYFFQEWWPESNDKAYFDKQKRLQGPEQFFISDATSRIHLDATPRIYLNHVARCQQRIPTIPDIHIPWRPIQHSGLNKQISRRSTFATCTTVHATINREIYIINFAYITITITSYVRHSDHITRRRSRPQYTNKVGRKHKDRRRSYH